MFSNKKKRMLGILLLTLCFMSAACFTGVQVGAEEGDSVVIKGKINEIEEVPDGVKTVILDGCEAKDTTSNAIYLPDGITVEIKDGTVNTVGALESEGSITIKGNGTLNFRQIDAKKGDVVIESGILNGGYILTNSGGMTINGGNIDISSVDCSMLSAGGPIVLNGGYLKSSGHIVAALGPDYDGEGIILGDDLKERGLKVIKEQGPEGEYVFTLADEQKDAVEELNVSIDGTTDDSDDGASEPTGDTDVDNKSSSNGIVIAVVVILLALAGAIAGIIYKKRKWQK